MPCCRAYDAPGVGRSALVKEVLVDALDHIRLLVLHAYVVTDHQAAQSQAINQDDPGCHPVCIGDGLRPETAGGDEDTSWMRRLGAEGSGAAAGGSPGLRWLRGPGTIRRQA